MELGLSLGDAAAAASKPFGFMDKSTTQVNSNKTNLGFCMALTISPNDHDHKDQKQHSSNDHKATATIVQEVNKTASTLLTVADDDDDHTSSSTDHHPVQLDLLPNTPVVPRKGSCENIGSSANVGRGFDVNRLLIPVAHDQDHHREGAASAAAATLSSSPPNSAASSFQMDFGMYSSKGGSGSNNEADQAERASSRASDEDENGSTRKKLRLSKDQSAFLEESFKEHNTLTPKQKLALAKQLNLRPRQVEVWFQNRRARTKLKQTEVDCEYLKRCCETLTEENRRLHKELQELRALKTSNPFYMQLPATTLTMCPSCERVASSTTSPTTTPTTASAATATIATITTTITNHNNSSNTDTTSKITTGLSLSSVNSSTRPRFYPFSDQTQSTNPNKSTA